ALIQRAEAEPLSLSRADLQRLAASSGPAAVQRMVNRSDVRQARRMPVAPPVFRPMAQIQAKLTVGPVGDKFEQEADRMANLVAHQASAAPRGMVQAKNAGPPNVSRQLLPAKTEPGEAKPLANSIT